MGEHYEPGIAQPPKVRYRECMKNHAAHMGKYAMDGCGEFMPSGAEGTLEGLKCSACDCHRNFHRREPPLAPGAPAGPVPVHVSSPQPLQMMMMMGGADNNGGLAAEIASARRSRRARTKFSSTQKAGMRELAEKLGWRIQKHDEEGVRDVCAQLGVKRNVLKVWMHNNKNTFSPSPPPTTTTTTNNNNNNNNSNNTTSPSNENSNSTSEHNLNQLPP